jgi:hypothetical protein
MSPRSSAARGVVILALAMLVGGALAVSPAVSAVDGLSKKEKKQGDKRWINVGEKASDSDKLDGQDSSAFLGANAKAADADTLDGMNSSAFQTASAYALVDKGVPSLVAAKTKGFTAVTRPFTGGYCLTPAAGVDLSSRPVLAVPDWSLSANTPPYEAYAQSTPLDCAAGQLEVITHRADALSNDVSFVVFVP